MLKLGEMCNNYTQLMHNGGQNVHIFSFFAQKICKCERKVVTLHPNFKNSHIINVLNIRNYVRN